jgi:hypothetical protein
MLATAVVIGAAVAPSAQAFFAAPGALVHPATVSQQNVRVVPNPDEQFRSNPLVVSFGTTIGQHQLRYFRPYGRVGLLRTEQTSSTTIASKATPASSTAPDAGFQYDDAAIGAAVVAGLVLLGAAGTVAARRHGQLRQS